MINFEDKFLLDFEHKVNENTFSIVWIQIIPVHFGFHDLFWLFIKFYQLHD